MSEIVARIGLAVMLMPITALVWTIASYAFIYNGNWPPSAMSVVSVWVFVYAFVATYWICLWKNVVKWTESRIRRSWVVTALALFAGVVACSCFTIFLKQNLAEAMLGIGQIVPVCWILGTIIVWKETPLERIERLNLYNRRSVHCPACQYNMTGLSETRCPECGKTFTIDELFVAQQDQQLDLEDRQQDLEEQQQDLRDDCNPSAG